MKRASFLASAAALAAVLAAPALQAQTFAWRNAVRTIAPSPANPGMNALFEAYPRFLAVRDGDPYLAAYIRAPESDNSQILAARISAQDGFGLWVNGYAGAFPDLPMALSVDGSGNAFLAGAITAANTSLTATTFRLAAADGAKAWQASVANVGGDVNMEGAIELDAAGNPVVANPQRIVKYDAASGAVLWSAPVTSTRALALAPGGDIYAITSASRIVRLAGATGTAVWDVALAAAPRALKVTAGGDPVVLLDTGADTVISQRNAASGIERWSRSLAGRPAALELHPSGDAIVAAWTTASGSPQAKVTRTAAPFTSVIWEQAFVGVPQRMALDGRGNPFVAGYYQPSPNGSPYIQYVVKLTHDRGTLVWRYDREAPGKPTDPPPEGISIAATANELYLAHAESDPAMGSVIRLARYDNPLSNSPVPFVFPMQFGVALGAQRTSQTISPMGFEAPSPISVANGAYSIGCSNVFVTSPGTLQPGESVCVRHVAASTEGTLVVTTLTLGSTQARFISVTEGNANDIFSNPRLFAQQQYRDFLGREGEAAGVDYYANGIAAGTMSRRQVVENFFYSPEFQSGLPQVTRLYYAFFNRIPDYDGLQFQVGQYRSGVPLEQISLNFSNAPEFTSRYGSLTDGQYVDLVYQNVLGRAPDAAGRQYYLDRLGDGRLTRGQMMIGFSESPEFQQLMDNEVYVIAVYLGMLRRVPEAAGLAFYVDRIEQGMPRGDIVESFLASPEYRGRFLP